MPELRSIPSLPGYSADTEGNIWSFRKKHPRKLKPFIDKDGYACSCITYEGNRKRLCRFSRLVLEAFHGPCPVGMEACHDDGNRLNNRPGNLRWDTHASNHDDKKKHGTEQRGEKHGMAFINETVVRAVRKMRMLRYTYPEIAWSFGLSRVHVVAICTRRIWKHVA